MKFSIAILSMICLTFGCCSVPKDLNLSINDDYDTVKVKLDAINSHLSGEGLISEMYFEDMSKRNKAWW
ncbi:MAG: hypothetical protein KAR20_28645, partial [Candidatus Heimdallarchaeota archaeon]|nr:hypothetical protein [Candidatus Heimdallarchaeota archaeon]